MIALIMAGGKGSRLNEITKEIPKPLVEVLGKPIILRQIEKIKEYGVTKIYISVGYLAEKIMDYFKNHEVSGVEIEYIIEKEALGSGGALFFLKDKIHEDFYLINGDLIFDVDLTKMMKFHKKKKAIASILIHPNNHPYDSSIVVSSKSGLIKKWYKKGTIIEDYKNRVNAGIHILSPRILLTLKTLEPLNLDRDILRKLIISNTLYGYCSPEYVFDVGTPERLAKVEQDLNSKIVSDKNSKHLQKAIFIDRDGTINKYKGFIINPNQIEIIDNVADALKIFNELGYLIIVVTNQPVIARGDCSFYTLNKIHNRLETLLGSQGAFVHDIYYCPHHPDSGFTGERVKYKIDCQCRKPKPGLLLKASKEYNIDLSKSYMIGDSETDVLAGINAGCQPILIDSPNKNIDSSKKYLVYKNLINFAFQLKQEEKI